VGRAADSWEWLKLEIPLSQATVAKYKVRRRNPPSRSWPTFLNNHVRDLAAVDFFACQPSAFACCLFLSF